jgi:hypothetical protein
MGWWFPPYFHLTCLFSLCRKQMDLGQWKWIITT